MGGFFCVWCGKCAKYLAFGTFATSTVGALNICKFYVKFTINSMCLDPDELASDVLRFFFSFPACVSTLGTNCIIHALLSTVHALLSIVHGTTTTLFRRKKF